MQGAKGTFPGPIENQEEINLKNPVYPEFRIGFRPRTTSHAERQRNNLKQVKLAKISRFFTERFVNSYITGAAERVELIPCIR